MAAGRHTFAFVDVVWFTAYTAAHGDDAAARLAVGVAEVRASICARHPKEHPA